MSSEVVGESCRCKSLPRGMRWASLALTGGGNIRFALMRGGLGRLATTVWPTRAASAQNKMQLDTDSMSLIQGL